MRLEALAGLVSGAPAVPAMGALLGVLEPAPLAVPTLGRLAVSVLAPLVVPEPERPAGWVVLEGRVVLVVVVAQVVLAEA